MCQSASFVITRSATLFSTIGDSHEDIITENHLNDRTSSPDFVRVEIVPPNANYALPFNEWEFHVDQDYLPDWWNAEWGEAECRSSLPRWASHHFIRKDCTLEITGEMTRFVIGCVVLIKGQTGGEVCGCDNATVNCEGQTGGEVWGFANATVNCEGQTGGNVRGFANATVNIKDAE